MRTKKVNIKNCIFERTAATASFRLSTALTYDSALSFSRERARSVPFVAASLVYKRSHFCLLEFLVSNENLWRIFGNS